MFDPIFSALAGLLSFFYELIPNYAAAIALLTVSVMLLLFPLTAKGMKSMTAMSKLNPEIKRLQAKHGNDKLKLNEEMMALFKEHNVTPMGGCLLMLAQAPVFIVMFNVIRGLTQRTSDGTFSPKYLDEGSKLYRDLAADDQMVSFGVDLAKTATEVLRISFLDAIPFLLLIAGTVFASYYQQRMITKRNPQAAADDNPVAKQMQAMTKWFPIFILISGFTFPGGLNVYFLISSIFRIGQQALIYKMDPSLLPAAGAPIHTREPREEPAPKPKPKAPPAIDKAVPKKNGSTNGSTNGAAKSGRTTPPKSGNRAVKKKKKRR